MRTLTSLHSIHSSPVARPSDTSSRQRPVESLTASSLDQTWPIWYSRHSTTGDLLALSLQNLTPQEIDPLQTRSSVLDNFHLMISIAIDRLRVRFACGKNIAIERGQYPSTDRQIDDHLAHLQSELEDGTILSLSLSLRRTQVFPSLTSSGSSGLVAVETSNQVSYNDVNKSPRGMRAGVVRLSLESIDHGPHLVIVAKDPLPRHEEVFIWPPLKKVTPRL
ncbi:hypothetical protein IV203_016558 [Nitzschia inconspicua]|uniref:Uncharacterized protein n=1 Tax=Nitzschia inconspicua TaxID=303405 RepID=A0A9K3KRM7_9STRA|nr:hypothetical protein IV203_016558 [Nitzschia inconspicua]